MRHERSISPAIAAPASPEQGVRTEGRVARWWRAFWERQAQRSVEALLHALDERTLKDIGLSRGQIGSAVRGDYRRHSRDPHSWTCNL